MLAPLPIQGTFYRASGKAHQTSAVKPLLHSEIDLLVQKLRNRRGTGFEPVALPQEHGVASLRYVSLWGRWEMMGIPSRVQLSWPEKADSARATPQRVTENREPH